MTATTARTALPEALDKIQKIIAVKSANKEARYKRIRDRFNHLYNSERKRYDDCIQTVSEEFGLAQSTITTILKG